MGMELTLNYKIATSEAGMSLLNYLKRQNISRKMTVALKHRGGKLLVNGTSQTVRCILKEGDLVTVIFPQEPRSQGLSPYELKLNIVYEDPYLLVIDKPAGIPTIPSLRHPHETLANAIIYYYHEQHLDSTIHFVNRLDRDTSGLLIVAKYGHIHHLLTQELKQIQRKYYAVVKGAMNSSQGTINKPIARVRPGQVRRCVRADGQPAITHFRAIKKWPDLTLVECQLETGRTHQIRVHLAHLGHPLISDTLYDEGAIELEYGQLLHSYHLSFMHPIYKREFSFETDLPSRFKTFFKEVLSS